MTGPLRRRVPGGWAALALASVLAAGCSDDPSGPGTVSLTVRGPVPLGAAVVEVVGAGVVGVDQPVPGWVELVPVATAGSVPVHRIVVVQEAAGELHLVVRVADVAAPLPRASVVEATDQADMPLASLSGVEASVRR